MVELMGGFTFREKYFFHIFLFFSLLSACAAPADNKTNIDLLSIASHNPKSLAHEAFNKKLIDATASKELWSTEPITILHTFIGTSLGRNVILTLNKMDAEGPQNIYSAVVIFDDIPDDDSILGYRYEIKLAQNEQDIWQIIEANKSWRCRKNRGHSDFSGENCA